MKAKVLWSKKVLEEEGFYFGEAHFSSFYDNRFHFKAKTINVIEWVDKNSIAPCTLN